MTKKFSESFKLQAVEKLLTQQLWTKSPLKTTLFQNHISCVNIGYPNCLDNWGSKNCDKSTLSLRR